MPALPRDRQHAVGDNDPLSNEGAGAQDVLSDEVTLVTQDPTNWDSCGHVAQSFIAGTDRFAVAVHNADRLAGTNDIAPDPATGNARSSRTSLPLSRPRTTCGSASQVDEAHDNNDISSRTVCCCAFAEGSPIIPLRSVSTMMLKLAKLRDQNDQRVALVTGGARGIGLGIVRRFLADGYQVAFVATRAEHVERALESLGCLEDRLCAETIDVTRQDEAAGFVDRIRARWGEIAILVNNAGISPKRKDQHAPWLSQMSLQEWARVIDVNLNGPFILTRLLAPAMIAKGYGRIINIGSLAGRAIPLIAGPHYAASKAGLVGLTRATARDLAPHGITVNCIAPGRILSDLTGPAEAAINRSALNRIPVGRFGTAEEVAHVAAFLASPMAGFITGATIDITGGEFAA